MLKLTTTDINQFAKLESNKKLAQDYRALKHTAAVVRAHVETIYKPIFDKYDFRDEEGNPIADPDDLYLCPDDERCNQFYEECDRAVRQHGYDPLPGYCPALSAEHEVRKQEWEIIRVMSEFAGIPEPTLLETRDEMIKLFLDIAQ